MVLLTIAPNKCCEYKHLELNCQIRGQESTTLLVYVLGINKLITHKNC